MDSPFEMQRIGSRYPCNRHASFKTTALFPMGLNPVGGNGKIVELGDEGMRLVIEGPVPENGTLMVVSVPIQDPSVSLPVFCQVQWAETKEDGSLEVGLRYLGWN